MEAVVPTITLKGGFPQDPLRSASELRLVV